MNPWHLVAVSWGLVFILAASLFLERRHPSDPWLDFQREERRRRARR